MPVNNFSFARDHSQAFFCFQNLDKKDLDGIRTLFATKFLRLKLCKLYKAPVSDLLINERLITGAFFVFRQNSEEPISHQALTGLKYNMEELL